MRNLIFFFALSVMVGVRAQTLEHTVLIDFGPATQATYSQRSVNPDANNNYWNNFTNNSASAVALPLIDKANSATGISIKTLGDFQVNPTPGAPGISDISQMNVAALGDMDVAKATMDYFFTTTTAPSLKFTGLSANKGYKFYVFGSRLSSTDTRISQYTFTGATTTVGILKTSELNLGGTGIHANNSSTYSTPIILADANGEIKLELVAQTGGFGYINIIKVEEYNGVGAVKVTDISVSGDSYINSDGGATQILATVLPDNATVKTYRLSVNNPLIATINSAGLLTARKNGTVTVTATSTESGSTVFGSKQVVVSNQPIPLKEMYLDFGPSPTDFTNGAITLSPDVNGNYWNNITGTLTTIPTSPVQLVDKLNGNTNISMSVTAGTFATNGTQSGGLLITNANYLGEFKIATATKDFFYTTSNGTIVFNGLNSNRAYRFRIFAALNNTEVRISRYTFTGVNKVQGMLQTSGASLGGSKINTNNSNIYVSDIVYPDATGAITMYTDIQTSGYGYISAMKLEELDNSFVSVTGINVSGSDITVSGKNLALTTTVLPLDATVKSVAWSVSDTLIAKIDKNGVLHPLKNGVVTVTASTLQLGVNISGSCTINISNQVPALYLICTGPDNTKITSMKSLVDSLGYPNGRFRLFSTLKDGTVKFSETPDGHGVVYGSGISASSIQISGAPINSLAGEAMIEVDMANSTYNIVPISVLSLVGATSEIALVPQNNGSWSSVVNMANVVSSADRTFYFRINNSDFYAFKRVIGTNYSTVLVSDATTLRVPVEKITTDMNSYKISVDLNSNIFIISCPTMDTLRIAQMGSSVGVGYGATNSRGYNYYNTQLLAQRYASQKGLNWTTTNISIGGNNTLSLLARINSDLYPLCSKYVIFQLSLGNEGIHESTNKEATFNQFKNNMLKLIDMAISRGITPVVTSNYTRNDYTAIDYSYIRRINMLIHQWNVPSVNLLGAIDDGNGHWANGYYSDGFHPNNAGYKEFSYAMIPSLFDALSARKPLPVRAANNEMTFDNTNLHQQLQYIPDDVVHSFTHSFGFKTSGSGSLSSFKHSTSYGSLAIDSQTGVVIYTSPIARKNNIKGLVAVNDGKWHQLTLTHFYGRGETQLYVDSTLIGSISENLIPTQAFINDAKAPTEISYRDWFFYRSGMNRDEIVALCKGAMLKSSLELYAPLDAKLEGSASYANKAQSTTVVNKTQLSTGLGHITSESESLKCSYVSGKLQFYGLNSESSYDYRIYCYDGRLATSGLLTPSERLNASDLPASVYVINVINHNTGKKQIGKFVKL